MHRLIAMQKLEVVVLVMATCLLESGDLALAQESPLTAEVKVAVSRGLDALARSVAAYPRNRSCFSCHHQTLPMLALVTATSRGYPAADHQLRDQLRLTITSFEKQVEGMNEGRGVGGRAMTVGYGLWAVTLAAGTTNATTEAMVEYLLKTQREEGHWTGQMCRPPLEESYQTCTVLAVQGLRKYASTTQQCAVEEAVAKAKSWLITAPAKSQEDRVARLWGLNMLGVVPNDVTSARDATIKTQRPDGGWAQLDEMESDAYATGQTLYVLNATGLDSDDENYLRGIRFLIKSQREDGNWLVESRSKPVQPYFASDDEDPLGKDQFISIAATSWAVAALAGATNDGVLSPNPKIMP
jgi:N-acyl-D-amino-acid deacylase